MKKKLLSTSIAVLLSLTATASFAEQEDWEKELNKVSQNFSNMDIELSDISNLLKDSGAVEDVDLKKEVSSEKEIVAKNNVKIDDIKEKTSDVKIGKIIEKEKIVEKEASSLEKEKEKEVYVEVVEVVTPEITVDDTDFIFLRNIPEGTRFTVKSNYTVLPKKKFIIFSGGERVMDTPQTIDNPEAKFCFIELVNSGSARILKSSSNLVITGTKTEVKDYKLNKSYGEYLLRTYQTVFAVENKNIRNLTCYKSEKYQKGVDKTPKPLTLKDLKDSTGGVFSVAFPAYEEI